MKSLSTNLNQIKDTTIFIRCNFDVPIKDGQVTDDTRIQDSLDTINALLKNNRQLILTAHLGRPKGEYHQEFSLQPVHQVLEKLLNQPIHFADYQSLNPNFQLENHPIILLDNLRFWPGEKDNDSSFASKLAGLANIYVNESFATSHRSHASMVGIPAHIPGYAGLHLEKEIQTLDQVSQNPQKPLTLVMGGAKLDTKEPLITTFKEKADHILVGGKLALDLQSHPLQDIPQLQVADLVESGKDITPESAQSFADIIHQSATVIWNGSMGVFEEPEHQQGTKIVAEAINSTSAFTLVGGGDTEAALSELDAEDNIDHISSGGGAMLVYLSTHQLPAIEAIT